MSVVTPTLNLHAKRKKSVFGFDIFDLYDGDTHFGELRHVNGEWRTYTRNASLRQDLFKAVWKVRHTKSMKVALRNVRRAYAAYLAKDITKHA